MATEHRDQTDSDPAEPSPAGATDAAYRQLYAVVEDLQKVLAERNAALAAAQAGERAKSEFLANMSVEFLNPLTTIIGFAEGSLAEAHDPEERDRLARILKAARRLEGLVRQLLAVARVDT